MAHFGLPSDVVTRGHYALFDYAGHTYLEMSIQKVEVQDAARNCDTRGQAFLRPHRHHDRRRLLGLRLLTHSADPAKDDATAAHHMPKQS